MAKYGSFITRLVLLFNLALLALANNDLSTDFSAFYFIQQWLPSYCNQKGTNCCYPPTGKPATNFSIYGLWPYQDDGSCLQNCPGSTFDVSLIKPIESMLQQEWPSFTCPEIGRKFWLHEWNKHGTCSKSVLDEMAYFHAALNLKNKINIFQAFAETMIQPNDQFYPLDNITTMISLATGFRPSIFCNHDAQGDSQIWQVLLCVDKSGTELVNCSNPYKQQGNCASTIKFPSW
ncbi:ribonuclease 3 [Beta vulgaris subsp. vulgaris]|uniref:ribonuclease 3 n=1 Tax=Beta vulgaris subsp. vulgaris TaxID=3555 RepID=UPI002036A0DE|nr:ribonuclease 3 [Beta vulgaris subsp. vulgaris]